MNNLPRHAFIYLAIIAMLSLLQIALGANLLLLIAIDLVSLSALVPLTRKAFDPNDFLFLSLAFYYGTFSLIIKSLVLQPVQMNLQVPLLTAAYLVGGFGMIFLAYAFVARTMTSHYPGTRLRRWGTFERYYANQRFLNRFTRPVSIVAITFAVVVSLFSHSVQEVSNGAASGGGLATLGSLLSIVQLALAMQLSLLTRRGSRIDIVLVTITIGTAVALSILNNQKALGFLVVTTCAVHMVAYRIRVRPRIIAIGLVGVTVMFLYVTPLVHIVRGLDVTKAERINKTIEVLQETHYNPIELSALETKMQGGEVATSLSSRLSYLAPYDSNTDRFTMLLPIDLTLRATMREPLGVEAYLSEVVSEILPKYILGEHQLDVLGDQVAWRYSIREQGVISRPALGILGTGYGVAGPWGILVLAPFVMLIFFAITKLVCNGSIWQNPWAIFIASANFFDGEADMTLIVSIARTLLPLLIIASVFIAYDRIFSRTDLRNA